MSKVISIHKHGTGSKQSERQRRQSLSNVPSNRVLSFNAAARGRSKVIPLTADHLKACESESSSIPTDGPYTESDCRLLIMALRRSSKQEAALITKRLGLS